MPAKPLWLKKALGWSKVALFTLDTGSDAYVAVDIIIRCHYRYAGAVLSFFWLPGLLTGGYIAREKDVRDFFDVKCGFHVGGCGKIILFLLGTIFGPLVFLPGGLYFLVKAAIDHDTDGHVAGAKL